METVVIKYDGTQASFNPLRSVKVILKASGAARCKGVHAFAIAQEIKAKLNGLAKVDIHHFQYALKDYLMKNGHTELAYLYIEYRHHCDLALERNSHLKSETHDLIESIYALLLNGNANKNSNAQRDLIAVIDAKYYPQSYVLPCDDDVLVFK